MVDHCERAHVPKAYVPLLSMALDSVDCRVLPSDWGHGAVSDIVQVLQDTCLVAGTLKTAEDFIDSQELLLQCGRGDELDFSLARFIGHTCRELKTTADGACGIHTIFGVCDPSRGEIRHKDPRGLIRSLCGRPLSDIRRSVRGQHREMVDAVASALWSEFVIPYLGSARLQVPNEEDMFLQRLQSSTLWASVLSQFERNRALQQEFDAMKARSRSLSSSIFLHSLRGTFWLTLAIEA